MTARRSFLLLCVAAAVLNAAETPNPALLVLEKQQDTLVIVDPATLTIVARVPVGDDPHEVAVSDDGRTAYISNYGGLRGNGGGNTISVVDLVAQKPLPAIDLGALRAPHGLVFAGGKLYFTAEAAKAIGRYDPATQKIDWILGTGQNRTHMVTISKDLKTLFTSNVNSATISIIDRSAVQPPSPGPPRPPDWNVTSIAVGHGSEGFDLTPDGRELWVANARDHTISVIDIAARSVVATLPSTGAANRLKITPDGEYAFVSDMSGNELLVIDTATRKEHARIQLPSMSEGLLMQPDGARVYTTLNARDAVAAIDLHTLAVIGEVRTGRGPDGLAWAVRH